MLAAKCDCQSHGYQFGRQSAEAAHILVLVLLLPQLLQHGLDLVRRDAADRTGERASEGVREQARVTEGVFTNHSFHIPHAKSHIPHSAFQVPNHPLHISHPNSQISHSTDPKSSITHCMFNIPMTIFIIPYYIFQVLCPTFHIPSLKYLILNAKSCIPNPKSQIHRQIHHLNHLLYITLLSMPIPNTFQVPKSLIPYYTFHIPNPSFQKQNLKISNPKSQIHPQIHHLNVVFIIPNARYQVPYPSFNCQFKFHIPNPKS